MLLFVIGNELVVNEIGPNRIYLVRYVLDDEFSGGRIEGWAGLEAVVTEEPVDDAEAEDVAALRLPLDDHRSVLTVRVFDDHFPRQQRFHAAAAAAACDQIRPPVGHRWRR